MLAKEAVLLDVVDLDVTDKGEIVQIMRRTEVFTEEEVDFVKRMFEECGLACRPCGLQFCGVRRPDGKLKGFVCFGPTPLAEGTYDIYWVAVDPADQGCGVGGSLVEHVCQKAREVGARQVLIETSSTDKYGCPRIVYGRLGFVEVARVPDYYRPGDDRVIYARRISADVSIENWR